MSSIGENVDDKISRLPEDIVSHILSLMPMKFAVQTSILSKRWRYSWMFVTNLDFGDIHTMDSLHSLTIIVDRILKFCTPSQVKLFRLRFPAICARVSRVSNWIDEAVRLKISELDLQVHQLQLPPSMFTCKTLTKLRLYPSGYDSQNVWEFQCPVDLPCLKTLDILVFSNPSVNAFKLVGGCPMLENLSLEVTWGEYEKDYVFNIPTLKRLKLTWAKCSTRFHEVILNVPNLEYLFVGGELCSSFVVEDVSSLVEACVSFREIGFYHMWFELINGINGVKSLSAVNTTHLIDFDIPFTSPFGVESLPIFPNMNRLELKGFWHSGLIPQFLESCPELKHLCIEKVVDRCMKKHEEYSWVKPEVVPACVVTKLTTIKFSMCERSECDPAFLKHLLWKCDLPVIKNTCCGMQRCWRP
ncbi:putative F-box domain, leucine-rich repeat domain superfamily, F-box-like domain superfamily [Helianthus debilis subsp. tardiflorus]